MNSLEVLEFEVAKCRERLERGTGGAKAQRRLEAAEAKLAEYRRVQALEAMRREKAKKLRSPSAAEILTLVQSCLRPASIKVLVIK